MFEFSSDMSSKLLRWFFGILFILYTCSNIHFIRTDQVAMIERFGALVNYDTPQVLHGAGFLWAYPKPIDKVFIVSTQRYESLEIFDVSFQSKQKQSEADWRFLQKEKKLQSGFHPEIFGYLVTGDQNMVHMSFSVQYRYIDPLIVFEIRDIRTVLHRIVLQSIVEQAGKTTIDSLITDGLFDTIKQAQIQAQKKMDSIATGIEISTIEVLDKELPKQVRRDFEEVQSAYIESQTMIQEAYQYKEEKIPLALSTKNQAIQKAKAKALKSTSQAEADIQKFISVFEENKTHAEVVQERLYREGIENVLKKAGTVHFIPPPVDKTYPQDFHIELGKDQ